jgi:SAM-dependent methyltransferase
MFLRTTRVSYDTIAADYAAEYDAELAGRALDRALLAAFAELVPATADGAGNGISNGRVADVGCGPDRITAYLHKLGLPVFGIDLSPQMVALARQTHPDLRFTEGSMTALDLPDGTLGGIVACYSIIHIPTDQLPAVFTEFHRVLAPGGQLLLVFQTGDEHRHRQEGFGHPIALDYYLRPPDRVADLLSGAGLPVHARLLREPEAPETLPRGYLLARKPAGT